jgi:hypothetical protein
VNQRPSEGGQQYAGGQGKRDEQAQCPIESLCEPFPASATREIRHMIPAGLPAR